MSVQGLEQFRELINSNEQIGGEAGRILRVSGSGFAGELARRTGIWHRTSEKAATEVLPKIRLNAKQTLREINQNDRLTQDYREHFRGYSRYEEIVYEELVREQGLASVTPSLETVARFLGKAPAASVRSEIWCKKTTPDDPAGVVENWDEIVRALRSTRFAWMTQAALLAAA